MKPNEAINLVITDPMWMKLCNKWCSRDGQTHFAKDLYQEFCLIALECDKDKIQDMLDKSKNMRDELDLVRLWCFRVLNRMWNSKSSPFYTKYRKHFVIDPDMYEMVNYDEPLCVEAFMKDYNATKDKVDKIYELMVRIYAELGSFRAIEKELGINHMTANRYVNKFRDAFTTSSD